MSTMDWSHVVTVLDAAYRVDQPMDRWQRGVAEALKPLMDAGYGVGAWLTDVSNPDEVKMGNPVNLGSPEEWFSGLLGFLRSVPTPALQALHRVGPIAYASIHNEVLVQEVPAFRLFLDGVWRKRHDEARLATLARKEPLPDAVGIARLIENFGVLALDATGHGLALGAPMDHMVETFPDANDVEMWCRITGHIANAYRIKRALDAKAGASWSPEAVVTPEGRVTHAEGKARDTVSRVALREAALAIERSHTRRHRLNPDDVTTQWKALVDGRWSVLETFERDGRRYYVARPNEPTMPTTSALSQREAQVVGYAALGHSNKMIAYDLGVSASTVANHIARAMRKLKVTSRAALIRAVSTANHTAYDPNGAGL